MPPSLHRSREKAALIAAAATWALALGSGLSVLHSFEAAPGRTGPPRPRWPGETRVRPEPGRPNIVLFAHPRCPCTQASLEELARIMESHRGAVAAQVAFFRPGRSPGSWVPSAVRAYAAAIPGVRVLDDPDGSEAARFGAETSGHLVVYDRAGALVYAGGITPGRGRVGDNPGRDEVLRILAGEGPRRAVAPVFGCPIHDGPIRPEGSRRDVR
jgi:hypothetical protein